MIENASSQDELFSVVQIMIEKRCSRLMDAAEAHLWITLYWCVAVCMHRKVKPATSKVGMLGQDDAQDLNT